MNLLENFRHLASYDEWANLEVISSFRTAGPPTDRALGLAAHIVAAEHVWLARIQRREPPLPVWPVISIDACEEHARSIAKLWREFLSAESGDRLDQVVSYKNSKGETYESLVRDILTHVFMHSTYHRGQIVADIRQAGHTPPYTDFIHGVRQGLVE